MYRLRIKESKYPNMKEESRYIMSGITQECLDNGDADRELTEIELTRGDVQIVLDQPLINATSKKYLAETDWYVVRLTETGVLVPADILLKRQEARDAITGET